MSTRNHDLVLDAIRKRLRTDLQVPTALNKDLVVALERLKAAEVAKTTDRRPKPETGKPDNA